MVGSWRWSAVAGNWFLLCLSRVRGGAAERVPPRKLHLASGLCLRGGCLTSRAVLTLGPRDGRLSAAGDTVFVVRLFFFFILCLFCACSPCSVLWISEVVAVRTVDECSRPRLSAGTMIIGLRTSFKTWRGEDYIIRRLRLLNLFLFAPSSFVGVRCQ